MVLMYSVAADRPDACNPASLGCCMLLDSGEVGFLCADWCAAFVKYCATTLKLVMLMSEEETWSS